MTPPDADQSRWFAEHLLPHEPMLRAWLVSRFPQLTEVDDIIQEAYRRVLTARQKQELRAPKAFFFATARNLACDVFRRAPAGGARHVSLDEVDDFLLLAEGADVAEIAARNQEIELMTQAIQALPERCRQVLTLRNVYGLAQKDIAAQMGISVRTVETQVALGIKRCTAFIASRLHP